jgi:hypothetical protein
MMFKCGVTRIGPLSGEELNNQLDAAFASGNITLLCFFLIAIIVDKRLFWGK